MSTINYISFAVAPLITIMAILYMKYKFEVKNFSNIRNAILLGAIGVIILVIADYLIELRLDGNYNNMRRMAFFVFVGIALSSEFAMMLPLRYSFFKLNTFTGPLEGIIYSIFIGLGFSIVATVLFAFEIIGSSEQMHNFTLFLYTYPIANLVFSIALGFFIGMAKLRKNEFIDTLTGLGVATFFHGLYYFAFVTSDIRLLIFVAIGYVIIAIGLVAKSVSIKMHNQK
ncbi:MAG: PrsW family intramembrane metalloprotease [Bacteroidetes bacterium]|nr:PrsW family intramembrane metalloprotease [Bacteroidota bacterium]